MPGMDYFMMLDKKIGETKKQIKNAKARAGKKR